MGEFAARAALGAYRGLGDALYPFAGSWLGWRAKQGKEDRARRRERYGYPSRDRPEGPVVWLHAASVGEALAVLPLVERIRGSGVGLVMTTGTVTSSRIVADRLPEGTVHQFQPLDMRRAVRRFLEYWKPDIAIFAEAEIWPVTVRELQRRSVPQVIVNARMSDRSDARWRRRPTLARKIFSSLSHVIAQSDVDAERYRQLGAPRVAVAGNLKLDVEAPAFDEDALAGLKSRIGDRSAWIAASTHVDEEEAVSRAAALVRRTVTDALLIAVPRHPEHADTFRERLEREGLSVAQRSRGEAIDATTAVYLADTMGETGLFYRAATMAFVGRSLGTTKAASGGQNPVEPVLCGAAVLSGRNVTNFRETYAALARAGGVKLVADDRMLAACVVHLLRNGEDRDRLRSRGLSALDDLRGALDRSMGILETYLNPLRVQANLALLLQPNHGQVGEQTFDRIRDAAGQGARMGPNRLSARLSREVEAAEPSQVRLAGE